MIVPDGKDSDKDLFFVSKAKEEAKEDAALLALLHLTPDIPHERKLPEPFKATWLQAVEQRKQQAKEEK